MTKRTRELVYLFLRVVSAVVVMLYAIFRVGIPLIKQEPMYLDQNDGYVLIGAIVMLLSVEVIKIFVEAYIRRKYIKEDVKRFNKTEIGGEDPDDPDAEV